MALALNNLKSVDMPLNKETKPNQYRYEKYIQLRLGFEFGASCPFLTNIASSVQSC